MLKHARYHRPGLNRQIERDTGPLGHYRRPGLHGYTPISADTYADEIRALAVALLTRRAIRRMARRRRRRGHGHAPTITRV